MNLDNIVDVKRYLVKVGFADKADEPLIQNLSGGVSSSVWKVELKNEHWVIKQALGKLKVKDDWFADVDRIHREHEVMDALYSFLPKKSIPKVLHVDKANHIYMMACAEEGAQTWKELLMDENFNLSIAENAASFLREMHSGSNKINDQDKTRFEDQKYFIQLRIEPFHKHLMQKYPELSPSIQQLIDELTRQKICLVHGDFSPKNILVEKNNQIVVIDFEVAHWGNPVFDLAYSMGHLMLKGWFLKKPQELLKLIEVFLATYGEEGNNLMPHLGLMLLARMDGKSPVNYIVDEEMKNSIRKVAVNWIQGKAAEKNILLNIQTAFGI